MPLFPPSVKCPPPEHIELQVVSSIVSMRTRLAIPISAPHPPPEPFDIVYSFSSIGRHTASVAFHYQVLLPPFLVIQNDGALPLPFDSLLKEAQLNGYAQNRRCLLCCGDFWHVQAGDPLRRNTHGSAVRLATLPASLLRSRSRRYHCGNRRHGHRSPHITPAKDKSQPKANEPEHHRHTSRRATIATRISRLIRRRLVVRRSSRARGA